MTPADAAIALLETFADAAARDRLTARDREALEHRGPELDFDLVMTPGRAGLDRLDWIWRDEDGQPLAVLDVDTADGAVWTNYLEPLRGTAGVRYDDAQLPGADVQAIRRWLTTAD